MKKSRGAAHLQFEACAIHHLFMFPNNLQALAAALINKTFLYFPSLNHL